MREDSTGSSPAALRSRRPSASSESADANTSRGSPPVVSGEQRLESTSDGSQAGRSGRHISSENGEERPAGEGSLRDSALLRVLARSATSLDPPLSVRLSPFVFFLP